MLLVGLNGTKPVKLSVFVHVKSVQGAVTIITIVISISIIIIVIIPEVKLLSHQQY